MQYTPLMLGDCFLDLRGVGAIGLANIYSMSFSSKGRFLGAGVVITFEQGRWASR